MKMKKENMDHIRERFEYETGVKLPETERFEMPAWTGRILAAAAGLICLVGLGLVWHKVSVDKQDAAETMLAGGEEGEEVTVEETEEAPDTEAEEAGQDDPGDGFESENDHPDMDEDYTDNAEGSENTEVITVFTADDKSIAFCTREEAEINLDTSIFGQDTNWTWPVNGSEDDAAAAEDMIILDNSYMYLSFPGTVGDGVLAMHACDVTETGFDVERGNYVITEVNGNSITYSHLDTICVSKGDHLNTGDKLGTLGNSGASTGPHLGIVVTAADGHILTLISVSEEEDGFYDEEIIED